MYNFFKPTKIRQCFIVSTDQKKVKKHKNINKRKITKNLDNAPCKYVTCKTFLKVRKDVHQVNQQVTTKEYTGIWLGYG